MIKLLIASRPFTPAFKKLLSKFMLDVMTSFQKLLSVFQNGG